MLKKLVNDYIHDQWVNYRIDIGFYAAKEKLLYCGRIMFCEPGTTTPKCVFKDKELEIPFPLPVIADVNGDFGRMYLNGDYSLTISNNDGEYLAIVTTQPGFDIEA